MKTQLSLLVLLIVSIGLNLKAQSTSLTLEQCFDLAKSNYPKIKQMDLIQQSTEFSIDNVNKKFLPQLAINGQASYQSAVTELPFQMPGVNVTPIPNDQYKIYGEINQPLTDLLTIKKQKEFVNVTGEGEQQKLQIELYGLRERINQIYFGILLIDAQLSQTEVMKHELESSMKRLNAAIVNELAIKSDASQLEIEQIKLDQKVIELQSARNAFLNMLRQFINQELTTETELKSPIVEESIFQINRPELSLFETQKSALGIQSDLITAKNLPHLGFFFQGGYGRPALNFLSSNFDAYYITGLRLSWNLTGFYTMKKEKQLLTINQELIDIQQETFEFNTKIQVEQQTEEIAKIKALIAMDENIITLHKELVGIAQNKLDNGDITMPEYISTLHALDQAQLSKTSHNLQLLLVQQNIQITTGN